MKILSENVKELKTGEIIKRCCKNTVNDGF